MRQLLLVTGLIAAALSLGCKTTGEAGAGEAAAATPFKSTGEISFAATGRSQGAAFDDTRVVGTNINVSRRGDGSWAGTMRNGAIDVSVYPDRVVGVDLKLNRQDTPDGIIITGTYQGNILRFEVLKDKLLIRTPNASYTMAHTGEGLYGDGAVKLAGEAASANPPWPQFALALAASF